ncbi:MAG: hypothetical protein QM734_07230 [Cyclobacteriaceae bacterium]
MLDGVAFPKGEVAADIWGVLLRPYFFTLGHFKIFVGYPILPWAGIMMLGYCFGSLYESSVDVANRKKVFDEISALNFTLGFCCAKIYQPLWRVILLANTRQLRVYSAVFH